jgi:hypothetical protein
MNPLLFTSLVLFGIAVAANVVVYRYRVGSAAKFIAEKIIGIGCIIWSIIFLALFFLNSC